MYMSRVNPVFPFSDIRREVNRLFDDFGSPFATNGGVPTETFPTINVWEDNDAIFIEAELPGMTMDDVELTVVGNELSVRGQRKPAQPDNITFHRRERAMGPFTRFVTLPVPVETGQVEAVLHDGVLTVTLPKAAEARPRRIEVKAC